MMEAVKTWKLSYTVCQGSEWQLDRKKLPRQESIRKQRSFCRSGRCVHHFPAIEEVSDPGFELGIGEGLDLFEESVFGFGMGYLGLRNRLPVEEFEEVSGCGSAHLGGGNDRLRLLPVGELGDQRCTKRKLPQNSELLHTVVRQLPEQ